MKNVSYILALGATLLACQPSQQSTTTETPTDTTPFVWENATVYFLLADRFVNGNTANDVQFARQPDGAVLRSFMGGDLAGITQKIEEGYFNRLGVNALWFNPVVEQIHGFVDEGTGKTYGFHGYWAKDWTSIDPNFGTLAELETLVQKAHSRGIRVIMDVVINHTGPVTETDVQWPDAWVRTTPQCSYQDAESTIACTLVANLPDIRTESNEEVELPPFLIEKWKKEGRLERELAELDAFFEKTGFPRAPRYYIMKWLTDYVRKYGIDGFRVDTAKHTEAAIWAELYKLAAEALADWKAAHPAEKLDDEPFFMVGEVYGYSIGHGQEYPYSDTEKVNFYENGFKSLINFSLKSDAGRNPEEVFRYYSDQLNGPLAGKTILNYTSSHDDGQPFDPMRENAWLAGTMLMLTPGQAQIYYGDETARPLIVEGAVGDANLRAFMNWEDLSTEGTIKLLNHWQKLGQFRKDHPAVGAGVHRMVSESPYRFTRSFQRGDYVDQVLVVWDNTGEMVPVKGVFANGAKVHNYYTSETATVKDGMLNFAQATGLMLLGVKPE